MKFELKNAGSLEWEGIKGLVYNTKEDFKNANATYFEVTGRHGKVKNETSDRVYYVIEGKGEFTINDEVFSVKETDVIIIPKNTPYDYKAKGKMMKLFLVHTPAYNSKAEKSLE